MSESRSRRKPGMGIAGRFTLGLGLVTAVLATVAAFVLLNGIDEIGDSMVLEAQVEMASETARLHAQQAARRDTLTMIAHRSQSDAIVQVGRGKVMVGDEPLETVVFLASPGNSGGSKSISQEFYAPLNSTTSASQKIMTLVILVFAAFVLIVLIMASLTARRITTPLNEMVDGMLAISRGRLDTRIGAEDAVGEVAHLATAVERMVDDLLDSQEQAQDLLDSQNEAANLRDVQRRLKPMDIPVINGWQVSSCVIEAEGVGTGDFVDAMHEDEKGFTTAWVGAPSISGLAGALIMTMTRAYLRVRLLAGMDLAESVDEANFALHRDLAKGMYCTIMGTRFNPQTGVAAIVSAGHQSPAVRFDAESGQMRTLQPNGIALGFDGGPIFRNSIETLQLQLNAGDALFMFSPRATKCTNASGRELGEKGVYSLAKVAIEQGLDVMQTKLLQYTGGATDSDLGFVLIRHIGDSNED
jgi:serine phosphatase RsbU (regulator of sigma subunit)